jgi:hypothetical protein
MTSAASALPVPRGQRDHDDVRSVEEALPGAHEVALPLQRIAAAIGLFGLVARGVRQRGLMAAWKRFATTPETANNVTPFRRDGAG